MEREREREREKAREMKRHPNRSYVCWIWAGVSWGGEGGRVSGRKRDVHFPQTGI